MGVYTHPDHHLSLHPHHGVPDLCLLLLLLPATREEVPGVKGHLWSPVVSARLFNTVSVCVWGGGGEGVRVCVCYVFVA